MDTIYGLGGNDNIAGNLGADFLYGGNDADTFVFINPLDTNDEIVGFVSGTDKLAFTPLDADSSTIADDMFTVGGLKTGAIVEAHKLTWFVSGGDTIVLADTNGSLADAEFMVTLKGVTTFVATDFVNL